MNNTDTNHHVDNTNNRMSYQDLLIDAKAHKAYISGKYTRFAKIDYKILVLLLLNKQKLVFREDIITHVWDCTLENTSLSDNRKLDVHIYNIRKHLKQVDKKVADYNSN
ncbi:MAG: winged helix-turn-helix domain-containing protein [Candidatus Ancillula sp.]|jgi:DNA-binding response OmpR family regulator|nr:winged helix-turn-helix domain-containing protein [Candidatus Ancillula sp.]